jgi:hypothetical protein
MSVFYCHCRPSSEVLLRLPYGLSSLIPCLSLRVSNEQTRAFEAGKPFVSLVHLHFFALGAGEVKRYMRRLGEAKTLAQLHKIKRVDIINVLWNRIKLRCNQ